MRQVIHWRQAVPMLITLSAMLCGFFSILVAVEGRGVDVDQWKYHIWSAQLILAAIILDGLDGIVARRLNGCSPIGAELDTYVDMTAFGIAPAVLIYVVCLQSEFFWRVLMTAAVVLSGVVRLARFKATDPHRGQMGYSGLPITACASWVALFVFISQKDLPIRQTPWLTHGPWAVIFLLGVSLFIVLQVSNVRYPKPTKRFSVFILGVVLVIGLLLPGVQIGWYTTDVYAAVTMLVLGLGYVFFGPLYIWRKAFLRSRQGHSAAPPPG